MYTNMRRVSHGIEMHDAVDLIQLAAQAYFY
jgi:hypothetical protein